MKCTEPELRSALTEIAADLRVALLQSLPTDDQIIVTHMKTALFRAETVLRRDSTT